MPQYQTSALLDKLQAEFTKIIDDTTKGLVILSLQQLNWKPTPEKWSILECLEHINIQGRYYLREIRQEIAKGMQEGSTPQTTFSTGFIGNYLVNSFEPTEEGIIKMKVKTSKKFNPTFSELDAGEVINEFLRQQKEYIELLDKSALVNLSGIKITSAIGWIVRFKLGDAFRFVLAHTRRHLLQAKRIKAIEDFPRR